MSSLEEFVALPSLIVAILSTYVAWRAVAFTRDQANYSKSQTEYTRSQVEQAMEALHQNERLAFSTTVMHFTDRFFDLAKDGEPSQKIISDEAWAYQFWSLQATEFYFFHHNMLPVFLYALWMIELAHMYRGANGAMIRESHVQYLKVYSLNYREMCEFFEQLYTIAKEQDNPTIRSMAIGRWVHKWFEDNKQNVVNKPIAIPSA